MIIGRFSEHSEETLVGHIRTVCFRSDSVVFEPTAAGKTAGAPAYRIHADDEVELGAAWRKTMKDTGLAYYDVKLDDPTFAQPIRCRLVQAKDGSGFLLVWERTKERKTTA